MRSSERAAASRTAVRKTARPRLSLDGERWVNRTLGKMALREKLGQLLMVSFHGEFTSSDSAEQLELQRAVEEFRVGGMMLATRPGPLGIERGQAYATAAMTNLLQKSARIPLLFAADFERGTAMRLEKGTSFPHAMAVAAAGNPEDAYTVGRITAAEGRAVGVPWIFAPIADVNNNPDNPIINMRSFGEDPQRVAAFVAAYVRGVEENGGLATAKHFPGHGDTLVDSHLNLPTVHSDRAHLDAVELPPFRAALAAGVSTVMTGHLAVPALEPDAGKPATLSHAVISGLLRREMGFDGLVVTDALDMGGIARHYAPGEAAVQAILAGVDLLLLPPVPDAALAALEQAAKSGRLPMKRIDEAVRHVLTAKARVGLHRSKFVDLDSLPKLLACAEFDRAAAEIADRGVTLLRDARHILPLDAAHALRVLLINIAGDADSSPGRAFENELRGRVDSVDAFHFDTRFAPIQALEGGLRVPPPEGYDVAILALFVRVADRKGSVALPEEQAAAVHRLLATDKPVIVVCFGSPYVVRQYPEAKTWLGVFSNADVAQRGAARAIFGQVPIGGRIPVSVPGTLRIGSGLDVLAHPMTLTPAGSEMRALLAPAYALLDRAVADAAFPGGILAVGHRGHLAIYPFGKQSDVRRATKVNEQSIYDAASLTKPVVTATLTAMLKESGQLDFEAPVSRYLPEWACGPAPQPHPELRARVSVAHLLAHAAGLPAHQDYFLTVKSYSEMLARALAEPLIYGPGSDSIYSDIDFILLGAIIERLTGRRLDQLAKERIFVPLGMKDTMFRPAKSLRPRIAPTQNDPVLRKRMVHGEVHDENAWVMGGVAGHAGIFSTAPDLAIFCQMMLNGGTYAHRRILQRKTIREITAPAALAANTHSLGWVVPTENSSSGHYFSKQSFGHTGFTGTSMWIDPQKQLFVVLLANAHRLRSSPQNDPIIKVRPAIHDAIVKCLGLEPV